MKFIAPGHLAHARAKRGATIENDGELILDPVLQQVVEAGYPLHETGTSPGVVDVNESSFIATWRLQGIGAVAAQTQNFAFFVPGWWDFNINLTYGNTALETSALASLALVRPSGFGVNIVEILKQNAQQFVHNFKLQMDFGGDPSKNDAWNWRLILPATAVGDAHYIGCTIMAKRIV